MALTKVTGFGIGTIVDNVVMTSDDPTITMTDSSGTTDIATLVATSGALIVTARDGNADGEIIFKGDTGSAVTEHARIANTGLMTVISEGNAVQTSVQQGLAKAWLRLNGTGTIAIRDSFGISGVTDNTTGTTTAAFSNDFSNDEFATTGMHSSTAFSMQVVVTNTVGSVKFRTLDGSGSLINDGAHSIAVHGDQA